MRLRIITVSLCIVVAVALGASFLIGEAQDFNVVFITLESTNADHIGFYGYERNTTPNIDRLAEDSIVFTNATASAPFTIYSVPSMLTSLYPRTDDVVAEDIRGSKPAWRNNLSLVRVFQEEGYDTKGIVAHEWVKSRWGFGRYFDDFNDDFRQGTYNETPINRSLSDFKLINRYWEERDGEETTNLAKNYLEGRDSRFFLWLHYFDPHSPYMPPEKKYLEEFQTPYRGDNDTREFIIYGKRRNMSESYIHEIRNRYDSELKYTDEHVGELMAELKDEGLYEDTVVVLTADHGECTAETSNVFDHGKLRMCSLHVPLMIKIPGEEHRVVDEPVSTVDIFPTLLEILELEPGRFVRGRNLLSDEHRDYHYAENKVSDYVLNYGSGNPAEMIQNTSMEFEDPGSNNSLDSEIRNRLEELGYSG